MSKVLTPCHILDRLREWFELYGNQNHQRAEEELHLAIDELYEYQQKDQRIAELEEQLKNAIVPKFKKGQEVWFVYDDSDTWEADYKVFHKKVMSISYNNYEGDYFEYAMSDDGTRDTIWYGYIEEKYVFATKEEAQAMLKKLTDKNVKTISLQ